MTAKFELGRKPDEIEDLALLLRGSRRDLAKVYAYVEGEGKLRIVHWEAGTVNALQIFKRSRP